MILCKSIHTHISYCGNIQNTNLTVFIEINKIADEHFLYNSNVYEEKEETLMDNNEGKKSIA